MDTDSKEYNVTVRTDDIREAIAAVASALYVFSEEALSKVDEDATDDWDFEVFLRDLLGVLNRHAEQLTSNEADWQGRADNGEVQ